MFYLRILRVFFFFFNQPSPLRSSSHTLIFAFTSQSRFFSFLSNFMFPHKGAQEGFGCALGTTEIEPWQKITEQKIAKNENVLMK